LYLHFAAHIILYMFTLLYEPLHTETMTASSWMS